MTGRTDLSNKSPSSLPHIDEAQVAVPRQERASPLPNSYLIIMASTIIIGCQAAPSTDDAHSHMHHDDNSVCTDTDPSYTAGQIAQGPNGNFIFTLSSIVPTPPEKGDNTLTFAITDTAETPVVDAEVRIEPFMNDHGHGTSPATFLATSSGDGSYTSPAIDLFMSGVWDITITAVLPSNPADSGDSASEETVDQAVFSFCLEG